MYLILYLSCFVNLRVNVYLGSSWNMCSFTKCAHATATVIESQLEASNHWGSASKLCSRKSKIKDLVRTFSPPMLSFIFSPVSYLFVAECISLTSLAVCVLLTWIAWLLLNVFWLGVEKDIVSCCQSTRLQLHWIPVAHPPKISRWLPTSPARYIWRGLYLSPVLGAWGTKQLKD